MTTYNKLVRDRIPELLEKEGKTFTVETLNHDRFILELKKKLNEELMEYQNAANHEESLEELADMLELIHALAKIHGASADEVEQLRLKKASENGGFDEKFYLVDVED